MKKIQLTVYLLLLSLLMLAQAPEGFKMQLLLQGDNTGPLVNKPVGIRVSILKGNTDGVQVYTETLNPTTNEFGLITISIGVSNQNQFAQINWGEDIFYTKVELDVSGGSNYVLYGISPLMAVPFSEYSKSSDKLYEKDPDFSSWNKSTGIKIQKNQVKNLIQFTNSDEKDLIFKSSASSEITESDLLNWNKIEESDPVFVTSAAKQILKTDTSAWNKKSNFSGSYTSLTDIPYFSTVSYSGKYTDLTNTPNFLVTSLSSGSGKSPLQFDGTNWVAMASGIPGQQMTVNSSGLAEWKTPKSEVFNDADRPFFEYNSTEDFYYCDPWNYDKPYNADRKYPLVIYLHYSGGAGDVSKLGLYYLGYDNNDGNDDIRAINFQTNYPSFILVPQTTDVWDDNKLISLIEEYKLKYRIDLSRIYIIGYSLGGPATYSLANTYYDYNNQLFAGIIRLTGESQTVLKDQVASKTGVWLQVGLADTPLRVSVTRDAYSFLKQFNPDAVETTETTTVGGNSGITHTLTKNNRQIVKKTEYDNVGHGINTFPFEDGKLITWLFSNKIQ